jgi:serine/threonine-protein kinase
VAPGQLPEPGVPEAIDEVPEIAGWEVGAALGEGGAGSVYRARRRSDGGAFAVKVLHRELAELDEMQRRFRLEIAAAMDVHHPNVVRIVAQGNARDGRPWYAMELAPGQSLRRVLAREGRLSADRAHDIAFAVGRALQAIHAAGFVHRDLKAANIMVDLDVSPPGVVVVDLGIAKPLAGSARGLTTAGTVIGSALSMAPEQIRCGEVDVRTDVYAYGVLLFQLFAGSAPFYSSHEPELLRMHLETPPPSLCDLVSASTALDELVRRCLAKRPEDRWPDMHTLLTELERIVAPRDPSSPTPPEPCAAALLRARARAGADEEAAQDAMFQLVDTAMSWVTAEGIEPAIATAGELLVIAHGTPAQWRSRMSALWEGLQSAGAAGGSDVIVAELVLHWAPSEVRALEFCEWAGDGIEGGVRETPAFSAAGNDATAEAA